MIQIKKLSKVYTKGRNEVIALKDINLHIHKGDIYGIIGLSGAGKSSLIRCINRLEEPSSGDVIVNGTNLVHLKPKDLREARKKIGMIFQNFNLLSSKTVFDNIAFPLRLIGTSEKEIQKKVTNLLNLVELSDKASAYPSQLSGGQKQRVGIARSLANDPNVLLCDEATSALDPKTTKQILSLLKNINQELGLTIVVITHEMEVIKEICNRVAILEGGYIAEEGSTLNIFSQPKHSITKHFVEHEQQLPPQYVKGKILHLSFTEGSATTPFISKVSKQFDVDINILSGNIEYIQQKPIGKLTIQLDIDSHQLLDIVNFLEEHAIHVEVIKP